MARVLGMSARVSIVKFEDLDEVYVCSSLHTEDTKTTLSYAVSLSWPGASAYELARKGPSAIPSDAKIQAQGRVVSNRRFFGHTVAFSLTEESEWKSFADKHLYSQFPKRQEEDAP